ncbi:D-altritol 5-dehydrogenase-like isoform X3 [Periplaneta americana]|uniref:D-altritol 5-dehydrogenase-like isoform X3 n=1 Tax=Periplaneta americana TaxID=6978 RepID=UPI0037E88AA2
MEALQFDAQNRKLSLLKVPIPAHPKSTEVLIRVAYSGICGTDIHITEGKFPVRNTPFIMGHEFSGVVSSVGPDVKHIKKGDNVVVDPNSGCLTCDACHNGNYHYCTGSGIDKSTGTYKDGGWAEYCLVPADQVHKLSDNITLEQETGYDIIAPEELKTRKAKDLSWGVDLVIDCSGNAPAMEEALSFINSGGTFCIFGVSPPGTMMSVSPYALYKNELKIIAVKVNPFSFPKALGWIEAMGSRYLQYDKLGIKTYSLSQYEEAFKALKEGTVAKAMFKM